MVLYKIKTSKCKESKNTKENCNEQNQSQMVSKKKNWFTMSRKNESANELQRTDTQRNYRAYNWYINSTYELLWMVMVVAPAPQ